MKQSSRIFSSLENPWKLGHLTKGLIFSVSVFVLFIIQKAGIPFAQSEVISFAISAGVAVATLWVIYGFIEHGLVGLYNKYRSSEGVDNSLDL